MCELERRTVNGDYILDCKFEKILDPKKLNRDLQSLVGVVENGLFINLTKRVLISNVEQVKVMEKGTKSKAPLASFGITYTPF
ncbi:ribose-5-phosphate isomerase A [Gracilibacillus saliphilus]|uniref:ribose-5-phosphate isomerase A n=1 Tax=Gracilibacillus saliphilus TaxID=543890 RepID=UPI0013D59CB4|nr:ribose-5-phosphate isomerase A [Gracilibacillus saliphilus]